MIMGITAASLRLLNPRGAVEEPPIEEPDQPVTTFRYPNIDSETLEPIEVMSSTACNVDGYTMALVTIMTPEWEYQKWLHRYEGEGKWAKLTHVTSEYLYAPLLYFFPSLNTILLTMPDGFLYCTAPDSNWTFIEAPQSQVAYLSDRVLRISESGGITRFNFNTKQWDNYSSIGNIQVIAGPQVFTTGDDMHVSYGYQPSQTLFSSDKGMTWGFAGTILDSTATYAWRESGANRISFRNDNGVGYPNLSKNQYVYDLTRRYQTDIYKWKNLYVATMYGETPDEYWDTALYYSRDIYSNPGNSTWVKVPGIVEDGYEYPIMGYFVAPHVVDHYYTYELPGLN